ncbi:hypothetical protein CEXT_117391 [Caerostris extrusa]|uniref:Uncharacterized protein n=1 Tax=Caerostris extrusa TaxID=172846 RepID=A0AAV4XC70_CAEEX|nr:hypothetical protein CEXT_117391 [Caerostris extrusa]
MDPGIPLCAYRLPMFRRETHNSIYHIEITSKSGMDQCMKQKTWLGTMPCHRRFRCRARISQLNISEEEAPFALHTQYSNARLDSGWNV